MNKIIINADDFGYTESTNYGIVDAHTNGVLTSTTIMANMPGFDHAVKLSKSYPDLGVGIHLVLTCGKPLTQIGDEYLDSNGNFKRRKYYFKDDEDISLDVDWVNSEKVYLEWKAQIDKVINSGIKPSHLDSHHHIHTHKLFEPIIRKLSKEYDLDVRNCNEIYFNNKVKHFEKQFDLIGSKENVNYDEIDNMIAQIKDIEISEIMCHPSYINKFIYENSSFNLGRIYELDVLISKQFDRIIKKYNLELINYNDL